MTENVLEASALRRAFGGIVAVSNVDVVVQAGELLSIIGPNGAGKTTLFNLLTGRIRPNGGRIRFQGRDVTRLPPHRRCRLGMGRTFQINNVFPEVTVRENVRLSLFAYHGRTWDMLHDARAFYDEEIDEIVDMVDLGDISHHVASEISYGDRRRLELAIALAGRPSILLLDEPTCGMSLGERPSLVNLVQEIRAKAGVTVILIEHDMDVVFSIAERIMVMHHGQIIANGTPTEIVNDAEVRRVYLGEEIGRA